MDSPPEPRVLIVADHASASFGGEAVLPLHYFRRLSERGVPTWMVVHERTREELADLLTPQAFQHVHFVEDTRAHRGLWSIASRLPERIAHATAGMALRISTQRRALELAKTLIRTQRISVVHQPIPVSPREPSMLWNLSVPVVLGPMNGGMNYAPGFEDLESRTNQRAVTAARELSDAAHLVLRGKLEAELLLVANDRTRQALPKGVKGRVVTLVENGVDLSLWNRTEPGGPASRRVRFMMMGRMEGWKAMDIVIRAAARLDPSIDFEIEIIGDGPHRRQWEALASEMTPGRVRFTGWLRQEEAADRLRTADVFLSPSVREAGGAVVMEAMACSVPVIVTNWGGQANYVTPECGIAVTPESREQLVSDFSQAMDRLGRDPELRLEMGGAGRRRVEEVFCWERKVDRMLELYASVLPASPS